MVSGCLSTCCKWVEYALGVLNLIRVVGGYTNTQSAKNLFDTHTFIESDYVGQIHQTSGNVSMTLNWYNSFKVGTHVTSLRITRIVNTASQLVGYFCVGYCEEAAALGFAVYDTRMAHPKSARHLSTGDMTLTIGLATGMFDMLSSSTAWP